MAGGKKKSLANKLAKMTDEERARYLQHKADMEEEAKRRKEQLIATFMKKKIKKEDAFSRLNLAKINQNWHQILRKTKCEEMKEDVEHLKEWIDRLLNYKNRTISKLIEELEEAEEQYSNNFQYHSTHIDNLIEHQHEYIETLQAQYDDDLCNLMTTSCAEREFLLENTQTEEEYLKTVLFGQETKGRKDLREQYEQNMVKLYESEHNFHLRLSQLRVSREEVCGALWRQTVAVVRLYVQQTDSRRMHLAELRRLDVEGAVDIAENEERIRREQALISQLQKHHDAMVPEREQRIKQLESQLEELNRSFLRSKKSLQRHLQADERKLNFLADCATRSFQHLETLSKKGDQIKSLANTCKKFETQREKISKWLPLTQGITGYEGDDEDFKKSVSAVSEELKDIGEISIRSIQDCVLPIQRVPDDLRTRKRSSGRPRTAYSVSTTTPESKRITAAKAVTIHSKTSLEKSSVHSSSSSELSEGEGTTSKDIIERCFDSLKDMENFWFVFNKVEIDFMEIKDEKKVLERENKHLRGMIRAVLEAAALARTVPNSRVSTRMSSRRRTVHSAPLRRVVIN